MHHRVMADGTVLFHDAFGLTRVTPAGAAKSDAKRPWLPAARLSTGGAPARVLVATESAPPRRVLAVDTLSAGEGLYAGDALLPDGARCVAQGLDDVFDLAKQPVDPFARRGAPPRARVVVNDGMFHPTHTMLGPSVGDDGRVATLWSGIDECELTLVDTRAGETRARWRVELRAGSDTVLAATVTRGGVTVVGWRPGASSAAVIALDHEGVEVARRVVDTMVMPAVDDDRVVTQPADGIVRVTNLLRGDTVDHDVASVSAKAPRKKNAPLPLDPRGPGAVLAGLGRTLWAPGHGETLLDLDRGVEIDRTLSAAHRPLRAAFRQWVHDHRPTLRSLGMVAASQFRGGPSARLSFWCPFAQGGAEREIATLRELTTHLHAATGVSFRAWTTSR